MSSHSWWLRLKISGFVLLGQAIGVVATLFALMLVDPPTSSARILFGAFCLGVPVVLLKAARGVAGNVAAGWSAAISLSSAVTVVALSIGLGTLTPPWLADQHRSEASGVVLLMYLSVLPLASVLGSFLGTFIPPFGASGLESKQMRGTIGERRQR